MATLTEQYGISPDTLKYMTPSEMSDIYKYISADKIANKNLVNSVTSSPSFGSAGLPTSQFASYMSPEYANIGYSSPTVGASASNSVTATPYGSLEEMLAYSNAANPLNTPYDAEFKIDATKPTATPKVDLGKEGKTNWGMEGLGGTLVGAGNLALGLASYFENAKTAYKQRELLSQQIASNKETMDNRRKFVESIRSAFAGGR